MSNPTSCAKATTTVDAIAYDGSRGSGSGAFTPTNCDRLPFAPKISALIDPSAKGANPQLTTVVESPAGQANARNVQVTLPAGVGAVQAVLAHACPAAQLDQGTCPASAQVGTAKAETPALNAPLQGPVLLVQPAASPLPQLVLDLHGPIDLRLPAIVGFAAGGRLQSTLSGLPDTALSRFTLTLTGGKGGLLSNARDFCDKPSPRVDAMFTGQNGASATASAIPQIAGCKPKATATLKGLRHPVLALRFRVGPGQRLTAVGVGLPRALRVDSRRARRATTVLAGGRKVAKPTLRLASGGISVGGLPQGGARTVDLHLRRGALRVARRLRAGQRVTLALVTRDAAGAQQKLTLRVRAAR